MHIFELMENILQFWLICLEIKCYPLYLEDYLAREKGYKQSSTGKNLEEKQFFPDGSCLAFYDLPHTRGVFLYFSIPLPPLRFVLQK